MLGEMATRVAIVDFGMGNLFSIQNACRVAGIDAIVTSSAKEVADAGAAILPGVGAFGDAMATLRREGLDKAVKELADSGRPLLGLCLGMQLLMSESSEFGRHDGLGIVEGDVGGLSEAVFEGRRLKVPHIGWNAIRFYRDRKGTVLEGLPNRTSMYFVHSFYVRPRHPNAVLTVTRFGDFEFCSSLQQGNVFGCQFHPERSGSVGLRVFQTFACRLEPSPD
jgi:imidazole glycerol-phosphate synthase subunit HisH